MVTHSTNNMKSDLHFRNTTKAAKCRFTDLDFTTQTSDLSKSEGRICIGIIPMQAQVCNKLLY